VVGDVVFVCVFIAVPDCTVGALNDQRLWCLSSICGGDLLCVCVLSGNKKGSVYK
jgi:hypothetical protein